ncbi:MAG TPA: WD40 repeat domain-containing protein [Pyrinomonadaceae bacterium]
MKRLDENVPQQLGEILIKHGRSPLSDAKLCENLLKDYCPEHKEEIALLALAVKERIASDLLVSQDGLERDLLRALLVKRLRKARSLSEGDARWAVESWGIAIRALARAESKSSPPVAETSDQFNPPNPSLRSGIIGQFSKAIRSLAVSPVDNTIVFGGDDCLIRHWNSRSGAITKLTECEEPVLSLAFSPNGVLVAAASAGRAWIVDLQSREVMPLGQVGRQSPSLAFSPGGKSLATTSAGSPCEIHVWNLQTGSTRVLKGAWKGPTSISFSPDGRSIAAADADLSNAAIRLWDVETGTARILGHSTRQITSVSFLPDGKHLVSGSWDETVRVWNLQTGDARILGENCSCISHLTISTAGDHLAASSLDGRIRLWDLSTRRSRNAGHCNGVNAISFANNDRSLVTASDDGTVRLWAS